MIQVRKTIPINAYELATRFVGIKEVAGKVDNPQILAMLRLDASWPEGDEVPWCSAFVNYICWLLHLPRSKSLRARSWLGVGQPIGLDLSQIGFDVVIIKRGRGEQPGPEVLQAPGHVGFFAGVVENEVALLGGNQADSVNITLFPEGKVLGVRRLV